LGVVRARQTDVRGRATSPVHDMFSRALDLKKTLRYEP
jgi:hypothetical protein